MQYIRESFASPKFLLTFFDARQAFFTRFNVNLPQIPKNLSLTARIRIYRKYFSTADVSCSCYDAVELTHVQLSTRTRTHAHVRHVEEEKDPACYLRLKLLRQAQRNERRRIVVTRESRAKRTCG